MFKNKLISGVFLSIFVLLAYERVGRNREAVEGYKTFIQYAPQRYAPYIEQAEQRIRDLEGR